MKGEARLLLEKAADSLLLGIEKFNCPFEPGRVTAVLIFLDHAFEMLLKASILQRGGRIRKKGAPETLGFDACVRVGLSDGKVKFLTEEQAISPERFAWCAASVSRGLLFKDMRHNEPRI